MSTLKHFTTCKTAVDGELHVAGEHEENIHSGHFHESEIGSSASAECQKKPLLCSNDVYSYAHEVERDYGSQSYRNPVESQPQWNRDQPIHEQYREKNMKDYRQTTFNESVRDENDKIADYDDNTVYDSACNSIDRHDFEEINSPYNAAQTENTDKIKKQATQRSGTKGNSKKHHRKAKTKTSPSPFVNTHGEFESSAHVVPEIDDDVDLAHLVPPCTIHQRQFSDAESGTDNSNYTDTSLHSDSSSSDSSQSSDTISRKPLPLPPKEYARNTQDTKPEPDEVVILKVTLQTVRSPPTLPFLPDNCTQNMLRLRAVLQSLIDSEVNYMASLECVCKYYKNFMLNALKKADISTAKKTDVKVLLEKVDVIIEIHKMFQIELSEQLKNWNKDECIGNIFHMAMVVDVYSIYVNSYESANEAIRELETKPNVKDFIQMQQLHSQDRMSLSGLLLKPIQRFPQFILIIKDLLKYTPKDHHDREPLQEAVTWIENVAHQLNERKRQSEQYFHGHHIMQKLTLDPWIKIAQKGKTVFLIRQDDMTLFDKGPKEKLSLFLFNKLLLITHHLPTRDNDPTERFKYKWHQNLSDLELTASAITPNMITTVTTGTNSSAIHSIRTERSEDDALDVASDLTDMLHDISVLGQINQLVSTLKRSYQGLAEDHMQVVLTKLQREIQSKDYQLQLLNSNSIILMDKIKKKKFIFNASNPSVKQEWCIDFFMAKFALDIVNIPSWHHQQTDDVVESQPCLLMKHLSVDMQRTYTKIKCAVTIYFPLKNEASIEHLWLCSSNKSHGQVSIVSLHTDKPSLIESFQVTSCEILCMEAVPGYALVLDKAAFENDTIWISTENSEISVFMLIESQCSSHRQAVHVFKPACMVITMKYAEDHVYCGNQTGSVIVYQRGTDGIWCEVTIVQLGSDAVTSMECVGSSMWTACGSYIYIIDCERHQCVGTVDHQLAVTNGNHKHFQYLIKAGVGVWVSFVKQPNICLYHSESKRLIQDFNISSAINDFLSVYSVNKETKKDYEVTCLMASLGLLWVGTNVGITLVYPLPRLREGIPRINQRPWVALHGHSGPTKFIMPVHYGPFGGTAIRRQPSSILKSNCIDDTVVQLLPCENNERDSDLHQYQTSNTAAAQQTTDSLYGSIENVVKDVAVGSNDEDIVKRYNKVVDRTLPEDQDKTVNVTIKDDDNYAKFIESGEHTYVKLEPVLAKPAVSRPGIENHDFNGVFKKNCTSEVPLENSPDGEESSKIQNKLSFRTELKAKLAKQKSFEDLTDRDVTADQVGILYPTLVGRQQRGAPEIGKKLSSTSMPFVSWNPNDSDLTYRRPFMTTPICVRKPDFSFKQYENEEINSSSSTKCQRTKKFVKHSVSFKKEDKKKRLSSVGTSFCAGSTVDTLRKQDSNTIMVLTGGDGYKDWKARQGLPNYRPDEPCLVFWIYKF